MTAKKAAKEPNTQSGSDAALRSVMLVTHEWAMIGDDVERLNDMLTRGAEHPSPGVSDRVEGLECLRDRHSALRDLVSTHVALNMEDAALQLAVALAISRDLEQSLFKGELSRAVATDQVKSARQMRRLLASAMRVVLRKAPEANDLIPDQQRSEFLRMFGAIPAHLGFVGR